MYEVVDVKAFPKVKPQVRRRNRPVKPFGSTILLKPGSSLRLIPPGSEIRYVSGHWEVHMHITNKEIVKKLAYALDAIAFIC